MGVSVHYSSLSEFPADLRQQVRASSAEKLNDYRWWCEPFCLYERDAAVAALEGSTKLYCSISDESVDRHMACLDLVKIVDFLKQVAAEFKIDWNVTIDGHQLGQIKNGQSCDELQSSLEMMKDMDCDFDRYPSREKLVQEYADDY